MALALFMMPAHIPLLTAGTHMIFRDSYFFTKTAGNFWHLAQLTYKNNAF